jgi:hypothetical protein
MTDRGSTCEQNPAREVTASTYVERMYVAAEVGESVVVAFACAQTECLGGFAYRTISDLLAENLVSGPVLPLVFA